MLMSYIYYKASGAASGLHAVSQAGGRPAEPFYVAEGVCDSRTGEGLMRSATKLVLRSPINGQDGGVTNARWLVRAAGSFA